MTRKTVFLSAQWRKLAIANYVVDPAVLKKYLPAKTEIDLWNKACYISLVGFMFIDTRVKGCRIPYHINFEEVNLRFYVNHFDGKEWNRGVVFIREIVPKRIITLTANAIYKENYETLSMKHDWKCEKDVWKIRYEWKKKGIHSISCEAENSPQEIKPGSEEEFITEHYWGFTKITDTKTSGYEVSHPRWKVYPVKDFRVNVDFEEIYGTVFQFMNNLVPVSFFLAEGSEIQVMQGKKI